MIDTVALTTSINLYDLVSVVAETAKGNRVWCPFCQSGTANGNNSPAMVVSHDTFHCFGCGEGGDAIDFVMLRDRVEFVEACKRLGWDGGNLSQEDIKQRIIETAVQRQAEQEHRAKELDAILAEYSIEEIWTAYNRRLSEDNRAWWEKRGVPRDWQDYLELGYIANKTYRGKNGLLSSSAYTIPYFHHRDGLRHFETIQYRLDNPERPQDRYRFEKGLRATWYQVQPDTPIGEWAVICEGAIKAIVTAVCGDLGEAVSILAVPAKGSHAGIAETVRNCKRVWIVLDPDCYSKPSTAPGDWMPAPEKLAKEIGKAAAIVRLPDKIDDMFLAGFRASTWKRTLKDARRQ